MRSDIEVFAHGLSMMRARLAEYREQCERAVKDYVRDPPNSTANLAKLTVDELMVKILDALISASDPRHARQVMLDALRNEEMPVSERDKKIIDAAIAYADRTREDERRGPFRDKIIRIATESK